MKNILTTLVFLITATILSFILFHFSPSVIKLPSVPANIALIYIVALVLIAKYTTGYLPGLISSVIGVICINYLFTYPYFKINFTISGYPITFIAMLTVSLVTSTTTSNLKKQSCALAEKEKKLMEAEKESMRATLLRAISHDLRTPLTSIIGASSYITSEAGISKEESEQLVAHIYEDANWLLNMVENILSVTKIQDTGTSIQKKNEALEEVMSESILRLKKRIPDANVSMKLPDEFIMVPMDALLIEQVIINLLENAVVHSDSKKVIELYSKINSTNVSIHVKDYGIGISITPCDKIFDGYYEKTYEVTDGKKGMGIGLSICKTIITAHSGEIHALNHGEGSEFYFTLPLEQ